MLSRASTRVALAHACLASLVMACRPGGPKASEVPACAEDPMRLFVAESIVTMDPRRPEATRMLVRGRRIVALGDDEEVLDSAGHAACVTTVDLGRATVIPGVIDGHTHVRELGMDAQKVDLVGAVDMDEIVARLRAAHPDPEPGAWIRGQGWDEGAFASSGYPDAAPLDAAFPENPVALGSLHGFAGMYNATALARGEVGPETEDPEGGTIVRRADGTPTGVLLANAQQLVNRRVPPPTVDQRKRAIVSALQKMAAEGVTSVHEAGMSRPDVEAFVSLADEGALPVRVYGMLNGNDAALMDEWFARGPLEHPSGMLTIRAIKVFYDGSLGSRTAVLAEPYADAPTLAAPAERIAPARIEQLGERAVLTGFQLAVHAIGDEGNRRVLDAYARALEGHGDLGHRWRIEHAQVVSPDFFEVAAAMGVVASMQPSHAVGDSAWAEARVGPERIGRAYAWRSMLDAGIPLIFNSDLPGEPWTPMQTLYFAVTRQTLGGEPAGGWFPEQAVTAPEALRAMTATSAYAAFAEQTQGRLAAGYEADFVVLDGHPLRVEPHAIKDIAVRQTWVAGREVTPTSPPR